MSSHGGKRGEKFAEPPCPATRWCDSTITRGDLRFRVIYVIARSKMRATEHASFQPSSPEHAIGIEMLIQAPKQAVG